MTANYVDLSDYSDEPDRYAPDDDMQTVVLVQGFRVRYVRVRDGVALSQLVLTDGMRASNWNPWEYHVAGGNGWVTAIAGGKAVMSAHVCHKDDPEDHYMTASAYGWGYGGHE